MQFFLEKKQWESDFFNKKIADLSFVQMESNVGTQFDDFDLICAKLDIQDKKQANYLLTLGFEKIVIESDFNLNIDLADVYDVEPIYAIKSEIPRLEQLVSEQFMQTRFCQPWFEQDQINQFYQTWIKRAVLGEFDDVCLVVRKENHVVGAISLRQLNEQEARVGLLIVAEQYRGQGIATELLLQAKSWASMKGLTQMMIATQANNKSAVSLYQKLGARLVKQSLWLYKATDKKDENTI